MLAATPATTRNGVTNWITATPMLPPAAFSPRAAPFSFSGKKKEMLLMEEAKLPPPRPAVPAMRTIAQNGVEGVLATWTRPAQGTISSSAEMIVQLRPPNLATAKE